jgi:hypothetical protein
VVVAVTGNEPIQVVIPPDFRPLLERWLASRGLYLVQIPPEALGPGAEGDLPTYIIGFR